MDSSEERSTECDKEWGKRMDEQSETMGKKQTVISEFLMEIGSLMIMTVENCH